MQLRNAVHTDHGLRPIPATIIDENDFIGFAYRLASLANLPIQQQGTVLFVIDRHNDRYFGLILHDASLLGVFQQTRLILQEVLLKLPRMQS